MRNTVTSTTFVLYNIGMVDLFARQYDKTILAFQEAVYVRVATLGIDHPDVQNCFDTDGD